MLIKYDWLRGFLFVAILLLMAAGCNTKDIRGGKIITGPAAADIVNYVNTGLLGIAELEQKSLEAYASVTGDNYTTDQRVYEELRDFVVPNYKRFVDGLRNIAIENEEVRGVHGIYMQAAESIYDGFRTKMMGIENKDENIIVQGNKKIEKGEAEIERWRSELRELYKKHGVAEIIEE